MTDPTNETRAAWAQAALDAFIAVTRTEAADDAEYDEAIGDLMCDLLHLAAKRGQDPVLLLTRAQNNYDAEVEEQAIADGQAARI